MHLKEKYITNKLDDDIYDKIIEALNDLQYGEVLIKVQGGKVI